MSDKKYDVLVVGELNVDLILNQLQSLPEPGKEKLAKEMSLVLGSSSAILASNLSALGRRVAFVGLIGEDIFGDLVIRSLKEKSVDTSLIVRSKKYNTGATIVLSLGNDRANVTYPGAMDHLSASDISDDTLAQARHLHFSSYFLQPKMKSGLNDLLMRAKKLGLSTSVDPQWDPAEKWDINLPQLLPNIDFFMPNHSELTAIVGEPDLNTALSKINAPNTLIVKMGTQGACVYKNGKSEMFSPFLNDNVVDTVGAGDSFNAGFLHKYLDNASIHDCMVFASLTGAVSTTAPGGTSAFTSYGDVLHIMKTKFNYSLES